MFDWNDLKAFLAVGRGGSTLGAAKALGVNQTTVARRIESLEAALKLKLFERGQTGSRLTEAGRDLLAEAEKVEACAKIFADRAAGHQRGLAGTIRITCTEILANTSLTPALGVFRELHPEVQVELIITDQNLDIQAGEADLAIRAGRELAVSDLVARKLADYEFALYCSRSYAARRGVPAALAELKDHDLIAGGAMLEDLPGMAWMFAQAQGKAPATLSNSMSNLGHAVGAGLGIAPLPCVLADEDLRLIRCSEPIEQARATSWVVTRRELKDTPRIRAFIDFLVPHIQQDMKRRLGQNRALREAQADNDVRPLDPSMTG
ncbi:MAG: LysR family transcriptional regulator [Phenylobacterium sp.]